MNNGAGLIDVVAHIEASPAQSPEGQELAATPPAPDTEAIVESVGQLPGVANCHEVCINPWPPPGVDLPKVRRYSGYLVSVHVAVDPELTVTQSHDIAVAVERFLQYRFPQILRVHVHQE